MSHVILSEAKDLKLRRLRSFAVFAAQDDVVTLCTGAHLLVNNPG